MNVVPSAATRRLAERMVAEAERSTTADVVLRCLPDVQPGQVPALIGLLLTSTKVHKKVGRPARPITYSEPERREANRRYRAGERDDPWVTEGYRQYQVVAVRRSRAAQAAMGRRRAS